MKIDHNKILNERAAKIMKLLVETYLESGLPVASHLVSNKKECDLSSASVRNVFTMLEMLGLVQAPHTCAGRVPTEVGLRFFVDNLMKRKLIVQEIEKKQIMPQAKFGNAEKMLEKITENLSLASQCVGFVSNIEKKNKILERIEFIPIDKRKITVILVYEHGKLESGVFEVNEEIKIADINRATSYLNEKLAGKTLQQICIELRQNIDNIGMKIDSLSKSIMQNGLIRLLDDADKKNSEHMAIYGMANLLKDSKNYDDIKQLQKLFEALDEKKSILKLVRKAQHVGGISIFIGTESQIDLLSEMAIIITPYKGADNNIVGMLGVIGPVHINYARVIPMVNYTAELIFRTMS